MAFQPTPPYVPNDPQDVAKNLKFNDANGNAVTKQFPWEYQQNIGGTLSQQIDNYNIIIAGLVVTNSNIATLQTQVQNILTSGFTLPTVSSGCLSSGTNLPIDTVTTLLVANSCAYNAVLGQPSSLYQAIASQGANLSTSAAFSQNSAMSGLTGWVTNPLTIANSDTNQWLSILDLRSGLTRALAAVTPTCSQVIIDYYATLNSGMTFNLYFDGYSFIPTGFADTGSLVKITDTSGNIYQTSFNIVTQSTTTSPLVLLTSGSALSPTSASYTVQVNSSLQNSSLVPSLNCQKTSFKTVLASGNTSANGCCPDITTYTLVVSSGMVINASYTVMTGLSYTPRVVIPTQTAHVTGSLPLQLCDFIPTPGGCTMNVGNAPYSATSAGTFSLILTAFR